MNFKAAGSYMDPLTLLQSPDYQKASDPDKQFLRDIYLVDWAISQSTPEARQKILQQQLEFDRARGEQMQKYRMINDTIANLGQAARAAAGGSSFSPDYVGQSYANVGNAYLAGLQSRPTIAPQVGQRYF